MMRNVIARVRQDFPLSGKFITRVRQAFPSSGKFVAGVRETFEVTGKACRRGAEIFFEWFFLLLRLFIFCFHQLFIFFIFFVFIAKNLIGFENL